jgi:hypothetical protein
MNVDTYRSTRVEGVFVTLPSNDRSNLEVVEELSALGLQPVRREYRLPRDHGHAAFARFVLTEIVLKGYATHGGDGLPLGAPRPYVRYRTDEPPRTAPT